MSASGTHHACVFGLSWGDEGKGKVVDLLCPAFDIVVRFNGGANAGHTVCFEGETFALHLLPSGVLHERTVGLIGAGVVVDPTTLIGEIDALSARGIDVSGRLKISDRAHLVLPYHKLEDQLSEKAADPDARIGTTSRGIGPCYADKMKRSTAVRFADLCESARAEDRGSGGGSASADTPRPFLSPKLGRSVREVADAVSRTPYPTYSRPKLETRVREIAEAREATLRALYGDDVRIDLEEILGVLSAAGQRLGHCVCDTTEYLHNAMEAGRSVLFEGANGMLLDVDHGTYPYVTSSSTGPHGVGPGAGVPVSRVPILIGTCKAYATRVGSGPFVSELDNEIGDQIRRQGKEFGTTTGRPRRCGWFDAVSCRYTAQLSGATDMAMMHLDTLSGIDPIGICTAYRRDAGTLTTMPADARSLERTEPVVELMPGWDADIRGVRRFEELPANARAYIERIEALVGVPISIIGVGPDRSETLVRERMANLIDVPQPSSA